jgi:hypothetical protein
MDDKILNAMRTVHEIQGRNGNWNHDPYMCGLYNGMELMLAIAEGRGPVYRDPKGLAKAEAVIDGYVYVDEDKWVKVYGRGY